MSLIREKYAEVVTQHFLGMTYETRPMYYLKVSEKAEHGLTGEEGFRPQNPGIFVYYKLKRGNADKLQRENAERRPSPPQTGLLKFKTCKGTNDLVGIKF